MLRRALPLLPTTVLWTAVPVLAIAGCGAERTKVPDLIAPAPARGLVVSRHPAQGVTFRVPATWRVSAGRAPAVAIVASGDVSVAVWRYPRTEPLPTPGAALMRARDALVAQAKRRDRTLQVSSARPGAVGGAPAVELVGLETVGNQRRRVRSTHVYKDGAEVVVDALAPPGRFAGLDRSVFAPLVASLRITAPRAG